MTMPNGEGEWLSRQKEEFAGRDGSNSVGRYAVHAFLHVVALSGSALPSGMLLK